jgi:predicted nucleic acid-binding protein
MSEYNGPFPRSCLVVVPRVPLIVALVEDSCTDALIAAAAQIAGCSKTVTFDRGAARAGMTLIE